MKNTRLIRLICIICLFAFGYNVLDAQFAVRPVKKNDGFGECYTSDGVSFDINNIPIGVNWDDNPQFPFTEFHLEIAAYEVGSSEPISELGNHLTLIPLSDNDEVPGNTIIAGPFDAIYPVTTCDVAGILHPSQPIVDVNNIVFVISVVENLIPDNELFINYCGDDGDGGEMIGGRRSLMDEHKETTIFPNPSILGQQITVTQAREDVDVFYKILDLNGKCLKTFRIVKGETTSQVKLFNVGTGMYLLQGNNASATQKIIIH